MSPTCYGCHLSQPFFENNSFQIPQQGLDMNEINILSQTAQLWRCFTQLEGSSDDDLREFQDSIHRLQQIIALRVARKINPEVWRQP